MAISYLSKVYEANPYVLPVDLNLLQKVNSYKQTLFYKNAEGIRQQLSDLNNSDILNKYQKDYLNGKVNNLVTQINNVGGIDYSDMNITHQIEGFGSDIYNDNIVLTGITSTKKIREFNKNVEKLQTDPKLNKYYNVSNITRINEQQIKPYVDGDINQSYNGPTGPRPYQGNPFEILLKQMKNLPPDITVTATANGPALYNIQTKKFLSEEDIQATFDGLIDANTKAQLADDAWYNFDYATGYKFDKKLGQDLYNDDLLNRKRNYENSLSAIDIELKTNIDPETRKLYEQRKIDINNSLSYVNSQIDKGNNDFSKLWDKDPDMAKYSLYVGKMRSDIVKAAGYSQEKNDYVKNEEYAWQKRKELAYLQHGLILNSDGSTSIIPGLKKKKDGTITLDDAISGFYNLGSSFRTEEELKALMVDENSINNEINKLKVENNIDAKNIIKELVQLNGWENVMGYKKTINTTGVGDVQDLSSDLIVKLTGTDNYLDRNDLQDAITQATAQGFGKGKKAFKIKHDGREFGMTSEQVDILNQLNTAWKNYGSGNISQLPESFNKADFLPKFIKFAKDYSLRELNVKAKQAYKDNVYDAAMAASSLTQEEKNIYKQWVKDGKPTKEDVRAGFYGRESNPAASKYYRQVGVQGMAATPKIEATKLGEIVEKADSQTNKNIKGAFQTASKNLNFYEYNLSDKKDNLPDGLINKIASERIRGSVGIAEPAKIDPLSIIRAEDGQNYKVFYSYEGKGKNSVTITPAEATSFGLKLPSNILLENYFKYGEKESPELFLIPNTLSGTKPVFYKIKKQSDNTFIPYINKNGSYIPVALPQRATSASDAEEYLTMLATSVQHLSQEVFIERATQPIKY